MYVLLRPDTHSSDGNVKHRVLLIFDVELFDVLFFVLFDDDVLFEEDVVLVSVVFVDEEVEFVVVYVVLVIVVFAELVVFVVFTDCKYLIELGYIY